MVNSAVGVYCTLCLVYTASCSYRKIAGPYETIVTKLESCSDQGKKLIYYGTKLYNGGHGKKTYNSTFVLLVPLDEHFKVHVDLCQWGNNVYKANCIEVTKNGCEESWKAVGTMLSGILRSSGSSLHECPIPKGHYTPNHWEVKLRADKVNIMKYNKYKAIVTYYYKQDKVGCEIVYFEVVEKPSH